MTKEEIIEHYTDVVETVFAAEDKVQETLIPMLKGKKISPREYCKAVAEEILKATPDEELLKIFNDENN